ncbi:MAG: hypothetical protein JWO56_1993 [Acidobacteria bacterium]|nr:hypothetical protein [Acidobacteriota bacterium]
MSMLQLTESSPGRPPRRRPQGRPWSDEENATLVALRMMRPPPSPAEIAAVFVDRTATAVSTQISRLQLGTRYRAGAERPDGRHGKLRQCIRECGPQSVGRTFFSSGFGERICPQCKTTDEYRFRSA